MTPLFVELSPSDINGSGFSARHCGGSPGPQAAEYSHQAQHR